MTKLGQFPITTRWPAAHPDRLQLYLLSTPNGVKVSIMLEETGILYEVHKIDFARQDQKTPENLSLNPNGKIPSIIDPDGPDAARHHCGRGILKPHRGTGLLALPVLAGSLPTRLARHRIGAWG